jgi:DNA-binding response OmpR family regulator
LLGVLNPAAETPRVLLVEARDEVASAFVASLDRAGMEVLHAASESDGVTAAASSPPDLVVMDLLLVRRRRMGIVDWLRAHERLASTPLVVYTADGIESTKAGRPHGGGNLYLAERSADAEVQQRIVDLLSKITTDRYA